MSGDDRQEDAEDDMATDSGENKLSERVTFSEIPPPPRTSATRTSRGRTRAHRGRPSHLALPSSPSPNRSLTEVAAAVTARLYRPRKPRPDLEGNYLRGSKDRISSPSTSPVTTKRSKESPFKFFSSGSDLSDSATPKRDFLKKGSKKQMTTPINEPLEITG
ncbi:unnamed protein product, partial [Lymnaea stagnalis]